MSQRKTTPAPKSEVEDKKPASKKATKNTEDSAEEKPSKANAKKAPRPDEMTAEVLEFITAIDEYKRIHQRPFPSWSEILDVVKDLGYERG